MASKPVNTFTTGGPGVPSTPITPGPGATFYNAYDGTQLPAHPTYTTPTGNAANPTFHGGIEVKPNVYMCHSTGPTDANIHKL